METIKDVMPAAGTGTGRKVVIAHPYVPESAIAAVVEVLRGRFIGQGPLVDKFEREFEKVFDLPEGSAVAVNSGTAALELAYDLVGLGPGDEVLTPILTCTATNIPLVRRHCKVVFSDIRQDTLTIDWNDALSKSSAARAIVSVNLHGINAAYVANGDAIRRFHFSGLRVITDACQSLGQFGYDLTACSFQAIKHISTGDGGMLICHNPDDAAKARLWRWFGIDRTKKLSNDWQPYKNRQILFDIDYPGYKFQMTDIAAAMGLAGLGEYPAIMQARETIFNIYKACGLPLVDGPDNTYGYACLLVDNRDEFCSRMNSAGIETNVMHVRNDAYKIFHPFRTRLPGMDAVEDRYICIPMHNRMSSADAIYVGEIARRILEDICHTRDT